MKARSELCESEEEERLNTITHGSGAVLSIVALVWMLYEARTMGACAIVGVSVFGISLILLYTASAWYHHVTTAPWKIVLQLVDHSLIYVLIAGSYTPWLLVNLKGTLGNVLLVVIWLLALAGILIKVLFFPRFQRWGLFLYLAMGWFVVVAIKPMLEQVDTAGLLWLLAGGFCYTLGVVFYAAEKLRFGHSIWHVFVLAGSVSHVIAVMVGVLR